MATAGKSGIGDKADAGWSTATPGSYPTRQPSRWKRNLVVVLFLALGAWVAWAWQGLREEATVGAAYGAQVGCICRYVSGRSLAACESDVKVAGLGGIGARVSLTEDSARRTITGSIPLLARQTADFQPERGCQLEPWTD